MKVGMGGLASDVDRGVRDWREEGRMGRMGKTRVGR